MDKWAIIPKYIVWTWIETGGVLDSTSHGELARSVRSENAYQPIHVGCEMMDMEYGPIRRMDITLTLTFQKFNEQRAGASNISLYAGNQA
jgi:hypothetical protein